MKHFILISGLLFGLLILPNIAQANGFSPEGQAAENSSTKEEDTCINMRGCGRRDKV